MGMPNATPRTTRPAVFAEPSHEPADEDDRRDIEAGERHGADIDRGGNDDAHHLTKLSPLREQAVVVVAQRVPQIDRAGNHNENPDIERKETGARAFRAPVDSGLHAADDHDRAEQGDQQRDAGFHRLVRRAGIVWLFVVMETPCGSNLRIRYPPLALCARSAFDQFPSISFPWRGNRPLSSGLRGAFPQPRPTWHSRPR